MSHHVVVYIWDGGRGLLFSVSRHLIGRICAARPQCLVLTSLWLPSPVSTEGAHMAQREVCVPQVGMPTLRRPQI